MSEKRVHIHCGVRKAETEDDLLAVLTIRRQRDEGPAEINVLAENAHGDAPDWLFTSLGAVNHCAVSTAFNVENGHLQARVSLCYTLDLADQSDLDYGLDTETLLTTAIAKANPDIEIRWPFPEPAIHL